MSSSSPPKILGDESSSTLLDAIMAPMSQMGVGLQRLATTFGEVIFHIGTDGASVCALTVDYLSLLLGRIDNVIVMSPSVCWMHGLNRGSCDHLMKSQFKLNDMFATVKIFKVGSYWDKLGAGMLKEAASGVTAATWHRFGDPPAEQKVLHDRMVTGLISIFAVTGPGKSPAFRMPGARPLPQPGGGGYVYCPR